MHSSNPESDDIEYSKQLYENKESIFSPSIQHLRKRYWLSFLLNVGYLAVFITGIFSLYWGVLYDRPSYLVNIKSIVLIEDNGNMADEVKELVGVVKGTWLVYKDTEFRTYYNVPDGISSGDYLHRIVHKNHVYMSLHVKANATETLKHSLVDPSAKAFNSSEFFEIFYESGKDPTNFKASIFPLIIDLEDKYRDYYLTEYLPQLLKEKRSELAPNENLRNIALAGAMKWGEVDNRPFKDYILLGPMQVGLIFSLLLTFFQLAMMNPTHNSVLGYLKPGHFLMYRYFNSWLIYFFLSLFFCTVSLIFQVDFTVAYGRSGFIVCWMSTWLFMGAVGGANENVASLLLAYCPKYIGSWLTFWIITNIAPTFFNIDLSHKLYRYGQIMPAYNYKACLSVIFLNLDKGRLGISYGIMVGWCVLNSILFPIVVHLLQHKARHQNNAS
ncbi:HEL188Cp [Eremothecium sinecaudum]|uniref:HEL188Cp n=1 Tax=Eremothecium sinecaudum TaxID=45286 RepID=A0A120K2C5_9SACH|nr:HEL188Cp [Eremothecium sinecaudum]AMD21093.1 HEL188Cp [Eremothecium sinecaudum]